jgi:4-amino-4-deoxy-L-arabinose transferase-like glycosyltransferase
VTRAPSDDGRTMTPEETRSLWVLCGLGLLLRIAFVLLEPATHPVADERTWTNWALEGLVPRHFSPHIHMIFQPPLYPYFIAVLYAAFHSLTAVKVSQAIWGALLVPAAGRVGTWAFSPRVGLLAGAIVACYPELVWFSAHYWSETLFLTFLWLAFERLLAADAEGGPKTAALAGFIWGLALLTRETILYFTPVAGLFLWVGRRPLARARAVAFVLCAFLTVAPWTVRNWIVFHAFIPVATAGGLNLWQGNALLGREEVYARYDQIHGHVEQYHHALRKGMEAIRDRQPSWFFEKLGQEMPNFWEADSQALVHVKRGAYGAPRPFVAWFTAVLVVGPYLVVLVFFVLGLASWRPDRRSLLPVAFLAYYNLLHVVSHGYARYRLPAMPAVFFLAASGFWALREGRPWSWRRKAVGLVAGAALLLSLVPSLRLNLEDPALGLVPPGASPPQEAPPLP